MSPLIGALHPLYEYPVTVFVCTVVTAFVVGTIFVTITELVVIDEIVVFVVVTVVELEEVVIENPAL